MTAENEEQRFKAMVFRDLGPTRQHAEELRSGRDAATKLIVGDEKNVLQIATRAGEALWKVKRGPDPAELIAALNRASAGDLEAQRELANIGIFDWKVVQG